MTERDVEKTGRPTLGVVAISYNEEQDLPGFLQHLLPWVDEIVIVDDGSTDQTSDIANGAGDKLNFIVSPRVDGEFYSDQRNKGIDAASSDWLLHMDIDERVTPALSQEILSAIASAHFDAYRFRRLNYFMHRPMQGGGWQDWNQIHLARRELFRFGGMFHETCHVRTDAGRIGQLEERMHHFNDRSFQQRMKKSDTYLIELTEQIEKSGKRVGYADFLIRPLLEFVKKYVVKRGFKDGVPGLISAMHAATAVFRAHTVVWENQNQIDRDVVEGSFQEKWNP